MTYKNFKTDFEVFYKNNKIFQATPLNTFLELPINYSFGVYLEFFNSAHIYIQIRHLEDNFFKVNLMWKDKDLLKKGIIKNSLNDAMEEGLNVAREYYSKQMNFDDFPVCEY